MLWFVLTNNERVTIAFPFGLGSFQSTTGLVILLSAMVGAVASALGTIRVLALRKARSDRQEVPGACGREVDPRRRPASARLRGEDRRRSDVGKCPAGLEPDLVPKSGKSRRVERHGDRPIRLLALSPWRASPRGCAQSGPTRSPRGRRWSGPSSRASASSSSRTATSRNNSAELKSENIRIDNSLRPGEEENGEISARLDDAKDLLRRQGGNVASLGTPTKVDRGRHPAADLDQASFEIYPQASRRPDPQARAGLDRLRTRVRQSSGASFDSGPLRPGPTTTAGSPSPEAWVRYRSGING